MVFIGVNKKYDNYHEMKGKEREMRILLNNAVGGFSGTQTDDPKYGIFDVL